MLVELDQSYLSGCLNCLKICFDLLALLHQLQILLNRVQSDLQAEEINVKRAKSKLDEAHQAHLKMTSLQEQDRNKVKAWQTKVEQKEMDRLGLTLHQIKR